jgi:hypothetical protein
VLIAKRRVLEIVVRGRRRFIGFESWLAPHDLPSRHECRRFVGRGFQIQVVRRGRVLCLSRKDVRPHRCTWMPSERNSFAMAGYR